jgi:hypothetical protein
LVGHAGGGLEPIPRNGEHGLRDAGELEFTSALGSRLKDTESHRFGSGAERDAEHP